MNDEKNTVKYDIKELLFTILYQWRKIIIVAIIFTVLCGGYKYVTGRRALTNEAIIQTQDAEYKNSLITYEKNKNVLENEIENLTKNLECQDEYVNNSILMQIDPYAEEIASISYYVDTDYKIMPELTYQNIDKTNIIMRAYDVAAQNGKMYDYILDNLSYNTEIKYLEELFYFTMDYDNHIMIIQVVHNNRESCKEIRNLVCEYFELEQKNIVDTMGDHTLSIIDDSIQENVDFDLENTQKNNLLIAENYKNSLNEKQGALALLVAPSKSLNSITVTKSTIKYSVIGFVLGFLLEMSIIVGLSIISDNLTNAKALRVRYNLRVLGMINKNSKKDFFGFVDKWLNKLECISNKKMDENEVVKRICANIRALLKAENIQNYTIMITGTTNAENIEAIHKKISMEFMNSPYKFVYNDNISYSSKTIEQIVDCDEVIIIEEIGYSTYTEIAKELENIYDFNKKVIGAIII